MPSVWDYVLTLSSQLDLPNVRYEYFDFHHECRNLQWDRISVLIEKVEPDLIRYGSVAPSTNNVLSSLTLLYIDTSTSIPPSLHQSGSRRE